MCDAILSLKQSKFRIPCLRYNERIKTLTSFCTLRNVSVPGKGHAGWWIVSMGRIFAMKFIRFFKLVLTLRSSNARLLVSLDGNYHRMGMLHTKRSLSEIRTSWFDIQII